MPFDVNHVWLQLINELVNYGTRVSPRGEDTLELLGHQTIIPMSDPVVTVAKRKLGYRFMAAEAAWILSGDNRVSTIAPFSKEISKFSDDGLTFNGAYGPKFIDQVGYVIRCLNKDPDTRQALVTLWRERPGDSRDHPCTIALQWLVRDSKLHCVTTMRSSDAWLGWPYDVHAFSMMSNYALLSLRMMNPGQAHSRRWEDITLGNLYLTAGSQHLYERNQAQAIACVEDPQTIESPWPPIYLDVIPHPDTLVSLLWNRAAGHS